MTEALTAVWCVQNVIPARQLTNSCSVAFYEELLEEPARNWPRIVAALGLEQVPDATLLEAPSQQANRPQEEGGGYAGGYGNWMDRLAEQDLNDIQSVLDTFEVEFYGVHQARPDVLGFSSRFRTS